MMLRWFQSRAARKFFRSRLAVTSLIVITVYAATGLSIASLDLISLEETEQRVGGQNIPGFFRTQEPEKRLEEAEKLLEAVDRALKKPNSEEALKEIQYGKLGIVNKTPDELAAIVKRGWSIYDELAQTDNINESPELLSQLEQLEAVTTELFPEPTGADGLIRSVRLLLGTDRQGRSILLRAVYSIKVAIQVGLITAFIAVMIGSLLGLAAAFIGGWVDHAVIWLYTTFSSIPNILLLVLLAYMFTGSPLEETLVPVYVAFSATFWIGPCRVIRGETLKLKELEYVQAATAIGFGRFYIMLRHILPNAAHLMLINFSLLFIGAIKSEVILSFLGLGVKRGPSWGIMISQSGSEVITGFFWQIGATTAFMFALVLAFNILSDALQDAFDPKHV